MAALRESYTRHMALPPCRGILLLQAGALVQRVRKIQHAPGVYLPGWHRAYECASEGRLKYE